MFGVNQIQHPARHRHAVLSHALMGIAVAAALSIASFISFPSSALAKDKGPSRQKVIDFDDEVVEGMNKRPLDSLSQISEAERRRRKPHLYRKRVGYRSENRDTLHELRYVQ